MTEQTIDFDARYRVDGMPGVAWWLRGWAIEPAAECQGHPDDGAFDGPAGETFYCDGSCEEPTESDSMVRAVMVGDDREHIIDIADLTMIGEDDYCHECGQVGCTHDGRERE